MLSITESSVAVVSYRKNIATHYSYRGMTVKRNSRERSAPRHLRHVAADVTSIAPCHLTQVRKGALKDLPSRKMRSSH